MTEKEKENRINSFALSFLERQQIVPNLYADQIIRGYKEGYHQAEKDLKVKEIDLEEEFADFLEKENAYIDDNNVISYYNGSSFNHMCDIYPIAKHFFELGLRYKFSYVSISNIDDTLKEMGIDPDSKIAKIVKESYCMALEKIKEKKGI